MHEIGTRGQNTACQQIVEIAGVRHIAHDDDAAVPQLDVAAERPVEFVDAFGDALAVRRDDLLRRIAFARALGHDDLRGQAVPRLRFVYSQHAGNDALLYLGRRYRVGHDEQQRD